MSAETRTRLQDEVIRTLEEERRGKPLDEEVLNSMIGLFRHLAFYAKFEDQLIESTKAFYTAESAQRLAELSTIDFLMYIERVFEAENERAARFPRQQTRTRMQNALNEVLIEAHQQHYLERALPELVDNEHVEQRNKIYKLLNRVEKTTALR